MLRTRPDLRFVQRLLLCFLIGVGLLPTPTIIAAPDDTGSNVELAGTLDAIWPRSEPFVVSDQVAFVPAINPSSEQVMGVAVVDLSRPNTPTHATTLPDTFLGKLYADSTYLFGEKKVSTNTYETHIYSHSGTAQPTYLGKAVPGQVIYSDSQYAVLLRQGGLKTIDLTNPNNGVFPETGSAYAGADALLNVTVSGVLAYAGINNGLKILNLASPAFPAEVGTLRFPDSRGAVTDVTVAGGYAYLKATSGLIIVDVSDPSNPSVAAYGQIPGFTGNVRAAGGLLYTSNSDGLHVYSLANPAGPVEVGYYREESGGQWLQIYAAGTTVYAAVRFSASTGRAEFRVLRLTNVPSLNVQATGPGVTVNGTPLAQTSTQILAEGDNIQGTDPLSEIDMETFCSDLAGFISLLGVSRRDSFFLTYSTDLYEFELVILARFFTRVCLPSQTRMTELMAGQAGADRLELSMPAGAVRFSGTSPELDLTIKTSTATIHSQGANHFLAIRAATGQTTTVVSRLGAITVTPTNVGLSPVTLQAGEKVDVTASTISPVTAVPNWSVYLPMAIRGSAR